MTGNFFNRIRQRFRGAFNPEPQQLPAPPRHEQIDALEQDPSLAWALLNHRNGHVRQAAVKALRLPIPDNIGLQTLAERVNDWVPQIRAAALPVFSSLAASATPEQIDPLARSFLIFPERWQRLDPSGRAAIRALVETPAAKRRVIRLLMTSNEGGIARHLRGLLRNDWIDPLLEEIALDAVQPAVRKSAYEALIYGEAKWRIGSRTPEEYRFAVDKTYAIFATRRINADVDLTALVRRGLADRFASVRWIAAGALIDEKVVLDDPDAVIARLLADKSRKVRERGEFLARRHGMAV